MREMDMKAGKAPKSEDKNPKSDRKTKTRRGWFTRLKSGLARSSNRVSEGISSLFTQRKLDDEALEELEEILIGADLGVALAGRVTSELAKNRYDKQISPEEVKTALAEEVRRILEPVAKPLRIGKNRPEAENGQGPEIILVVGVNGTGKTTTIGKLAAQFSREGKKVMLAAGDTFRAAAIEQLAVWGERTQSPVISDKVGGDAAGLAYEAVSRARADGVDLLLIDTAGRLQNKSNLMAELEKIIRVIKKLDPSAPHQILLVLDATTGQNALSQLESFKKIADISGMVMTKLDGTAKGGILVACAEKFGLPIHAIGVGEGIEDLQPFDAKSFALALVENSSDT